MAKLALSSFTQMVLLFLKKKMYLVLFYVNGCFACMYVLSTNRVSKVRRGTKFLETEAVDGC